MYLIQYKHTVMSISTLYNDTNSPYLLRKLVIEVVLVGRLPGSAVRIVQEFFHCTACKNQLAIIYVYIHIYI